MKAPRAIPGLLALVLVTASGCAAYRVDSTIVDSASAPLSGAPQQVLLAQDNLPGRRYVVIGPIQVSVKKLTVFHKDPTRGQADEALIGKAREIGASAVINIKYTEGIGMMTWGYIDAEGTAVRLIN